MILNDYSAVVVLALLILLIENHDILLNRNESFNVPAWKVYRKYLFVIIAYYLTDIAYDSESLFDHRGSGSSDPSD